MRKYRESGSSDNMIDRGQHVVYTLVVPDISSGIRTVTGCQPNFQVLQTFQKLHGRSAVVVPPALKF